MEISERSGRTAAAPRVSVPAPLRVPVLGNVLTKTFARLEWYLKEVIPLFVLGTAILWREPRAAA